MEDKLSYCMWIYSFDGYSNISRFYRNAFTWKQCAIWNRKTNATWKVSSIIGDPKFEILKRLWYPYGHIFDKSRDSSSRLVGKLNISGYQHWIQQLETILKLNSYFIIVCQRLDLPHWSMSYKIWRRNIVLKEINKIY